MNQTVDKLESARGGARVGAGRKRNEIPRRRHTVYCNSKELAYIKEFLREIRRVDLTRKEINKVKGQAEPYDRAVRSSIEVEESVRNTKISDLVERTSFDL